MSWTPLRLAAPPAGSASNANANVRLIVVDPWSHGKQIDLSGNNTYLSFPNAVEAVAGQIGQGAAQAALGIAVTASNLTDMASNLGAFGSAFPLPNLQRLARRAQALMALEIEKFNLVPYGQAEMSVNMSSLPSVKALRRADLLQEAADRAAAFSAQTGASQTLAQLQAEVVASLSAIADAATQAASGLTGTPPGCYRFYAEGDLASKLAIGHPGHAFTLTSIMLFVGQPSDLALLKAIIREP